MHGEIEEGAVIYDKESGKSHGNGFITYKHMESTQTALRAPSKLIDVSICHFLVIYTGHSCITKWNDFCHLILFKRCLFCVGVRYIC